MASAPSVSQPWTMRVQSPASGAGTSTCSADVPPHSLAELAVVEGSLAGGRTGTGRCRPWRRRCSRRTARSAGARVPAATGIGDDVDADPGLEGDVDVVGRVVDDRAWSRPLAGTRPCTGVVERRRCTRRSPRSRSCPTCPSPVTSSGAERATGLTAIGLRTLWRAVAPRERAEGPLVEGGAGCRRERHRVGRGRAGRERRAPAGSTPTATPGGALDGRRRTSPAGPTFVTSRVTVCDAGELADADRRQVEVARVDRPDAGRHVAPRDRGRRRRRGSAR